MKLTRDWEALVKRRKDEVWGGGIGPKRFMGGARLSEIKVMVAVLRLFEAGGRRGDGFGVKSEWAYLMQFSRCGS
jgi:hypothetical protein